MAPANPALRDALRERSLTDIGWLTAAVALLVAHNLAVNLWVPARGYVPVNLTTTGALIGIAFTAGATNDELGLALSGLPVGLACGAAVGAALALLAASPATRPFLADQRMAGVDARGTAYRALVRIPLGTVVLEEVAFRGALPALLEPVTSAEGAVVVASLLFGVWHVIPTVKTLDANRLARARRRRVLAVAGAVTFTAAVGVGFCALRRATGSLVAPAIVHWVANAGATVAAFGALRGRRSDPRSAGQHEAGRSQPQHGKGGAHDQHA